MLRPITILLTLAAAAGSSSAQGAPPSARQQILDVARTRATALAAQPVRLKVDRLNSEHGWAVLVGELVAPRGKTIDWSLASGCHADLDRMLWVVLHRRGGAWRVEHIEICASEPPYWHPEQYGGLVWPCGVYAGLEDGGDETLEARCRHQAPATR